MGLGGMGVGGWGEGVLLVSSEAKVPNEKF